MSGGIKKKSPLWLARKRKGLKQKQLAHLLGRQTVNQISRYENGSRLPSLETALALEILLSVPLRVLFADLYDQVQGQIRERAKLDHRLLEALATNVNIGACSFLDLLTSPLSASEKIKEMRKHAIELTNQLSDLIARNESE